MLQSLLHPPRGQRFVVSGECTRGLFDRVVVEAFFFFYGLHKRQALNVILKRAPKCASAVASGGRVNWRDFKQGKHL